MNKKGIEKSETVTEVKEIEARNPDDLDSIPYQVMDSADEESMGAFFRGMPLETLDKWVYEFPSGGKTVKGLSWVGTKEATVWLSKLGKKNRMVISEEPQYTKTEEITIDNVRYCDATVVFKDLDTGRTISGNSRQSYLRKGGSKQDVEFIPRMALSKAQRNAIQKLIPEQTILLFIDYARSQGKVQQLALPKGQTRLTEEQAQQAAPYFTAINQLNNREELEAYYKKVRKETEKLSAPILLAITSAFQIRAQNIKNEAAKEKVKKMEEARK
jgi:hypothetical protein